MASLTTFLDQGVLPFTGREREGEEIVRFWEETFEAGSLRVALLIGEAGIGKSRLLMETLPTIVEKGGAVIHTKLYPEATTSPIPLVVQALGYSETARSLLRGEIEPTQASVAAALRRIARLRPTLLVVEDIHLLEGESLREFSGLLNAIADETISLFCVARPVELEARGPLERYLVRETRLAGLNQDDVAKLWTATFTSEVGEEIIAPLCEATQGNPLALRSAFRGALRSGNLVDNGDRSGWRPTGPAATFATGLRRNVSLLAEGMTSHLTTEELHAAESLATLGEVFSREAAAAMIAESIPTIERLMRAGIVATNDGPVTTIYEAASQWAPLAFTHTLLHNHLATHASVDADRLVDTIAEGHPLYSIHPLRLIAGASQEITRLEEILRAVIDRTDKAAMALDTTPDWQLGMDVWRVAAALTEILGRGVSERERDLLEARMVHRKLGLLRRDPSSEEFRGLVDRIMEITDGRDGDFVKYRLAGLRWLFWLNFRTDYPTCQRILEEVDLLVEKHSELDLAMIYVDFLSLVTRAALVIADSTLLRIVEHRLDLFLAHTPKESEAHAFADNHLRQEFLQLFDTPEELEERLQLLQRLEQTAGPNNLIFHQRRIGFLESTGFMETTLKSCDRALELSVEHGMHFEAFNFTLIREYARAALGTPLEEIEQKVNRACSLVDASAHTDVGIYLSLVGLLRCDARWQRKMVDRYLQSDESLSSSERVMLAVAENTINLLAGTLTEGDQGALWNLVRFAASDIPESRGDLVAELHDLLARPILRIDDLLPMHAVAALTGAIRKKDPLFAKEISPEVRLAIHKALAWLNERGLSAYLTAIIDNYGAFLTKNDVKEWQERIAKIVLAQRPTHRRRTIDGRIRLSLLGAIEAYLPDGTTQRFQGARMKKMLGVLVGNAMLPRPLSRTEFNRLVAGDEDDALARKNTNMGAVRLRDTLGSEFLLMGEETHELNVDLVEVNLLEADSLIKEAAESLRSRSLMRGAHGVIKALEILGTEVPFPGLYDTFFETLRDDFEQRLRTTIINVGRELLQAGDPEAARLLLDHGFAVLPDDEEVSELLQKTLVVLGERTEAERIRRQRVEALKGV